MSDEAKDFVRTLLQRCPDARPTAQQALEHPWLKDGTTHDRRKGSPLSLAVVQRIQVCGDGASTCCVDVRDCRCAYVLRDSVYSHTCCSQRFGQGSMFKRTVLQHIAEDLLASSLSAARPPTERVVPLQPGTATPLVALPTDSPLLFLYEQLGFADGVERVSREEIHAGLQRLGTKHRYTCNNGDSCASMAAVVFSTAPPQWYRMMWLFHPPTPQVTACIPASCTGCSTSSTPPTLGWSAAPRWLQR